VPLVHERAVGAAFVIDAVRADEEPCDFLDRFLRRRQPDALHACGGHLLQPLERQCQMRPATRADDGVNFVDDHGAGRSQHVAAALCGEEQVQRFGRRHQDVRRRAKHRGTLGLGRVSGPHRAGHPAWRESHFCHDSPDATARLGKVLVDVAAERLERRHVDDADFVRQCGALRLAHQIVERREKRGQRLAGSRGRGDQRGAASTYRGPALLL
jgi:hypothetical protein